MTNFYEGRHQPTAADYKREIEEREKRFDALPQDQRDKVFYAQEQEAMLRAGASIKVDRTDEEAQKLTYFLHSYRDFVKDNPEAKKLCWSGYSDDLGTKAINLIPSFGKRASYIRAQIKIHIKSKKEEAKQRMESELSNQAYRKETLERVEKELTEARQDQTLQQDLKRKPARIFSDEEKAKLIDVQSYSLEDLQRSRQNFVEKKTKLLKQVKGCEKEILKFEAEKQPFDEKATELREKLDHDE